ncbi:MAG: transposase [Gammaproteobacteria bacterium]|nr:transposase [Gammaproteobacteria bacterium]
MAGVVRADLERMSEWLASCGVREVAMESTGVYWIPVFEVLDRAGFEVHLVNARATKQVSG